MGRTASCLVRVKLRSVVNTFAHDFGLELWVIVVLSYAVDSVVILIVAIFRRSIERRYHDVRLENYTRFNNSQSKEERIGPLNFGFLRCSKVRGHTRSANLL